MKILVKDILTQKSNFEGTIPSDALDVDCEYWRLESDAWVSVDAYRVGDYVDLTVQVEADVLLTCTRCLEQVRSRKNWRFAHHLKIVNESQEIDVAQLVREEMILGIGIKVLCREDCQGICPVCGGNRNIGECKCNGLEVI